MTVEQAAAALGVKPGLVYKLCARDMIGHERIGFGRGVIRISEEDVKVYRAKVRRHPVTPDPKPAAAPTLKVRDYVGEYERKRRASR